MSGSEHTREGAPASPSIGGAGPGDAQILGWRLSLYPEAREAAGTYTGLRDLVSGRRGVPGESPNAERTAKVAASRARTAVRRYCVANRTNRFGTLTYRGTGCHDPEQLRSDLGEFFRRLRTAIGGQRFAYVWVPEWHHTDHGLHAHFACGRYIERSLIEEAWGHGFIKIKLLGNLPVGSTTVDEARVAARYLSKYLNKDFEERRALGLHRYDCAQGFQPRRIVLPGPSLGEALTRACEIMGGRPSSYSTSAEWPDWSGPDAVAMTWPS